VAEAERGTPSAYRKVYGVPVGEGR